RLVQLAIPFCVPVPLIAVWMLRTQGSEAHVQSTSVSFGPFVDRFSHLASQATGIDFFWPIASPLLAGAIVLAPWFLGLRMTRNPTRWAMFLATCAVFFGFPHYALGTAFLYQRFGGLVLIFWLMLWSAPSTDQASDRRWRELLVMAVVVVIGCFNVLRFSAFDAENAHFTRVLSAMEPGRRVASVVSQFRSDQFSNPVYLHHALWYQVGAKGVVDFNFAFFFPQLVRYRAEAAPPFGDRFAWDPFAYSWSQFNGDAYDYFLFHGPPNAPARFFRNRLGSVTLVAQSGAWSVYQRISE
nr:hypothetical protein [Gammaproteobacteria bacterium]